MNADAWRLNPSAPEFFAASWNAWSFDGDVLFGSASTRMLNAYSPGAFRLQIKICDGAIPGNAQTQCF
jgi:hypothetical protein